MKIWPRGEVEKSLDWRGRNNENVEFPRVAEKHADCDIFKSWCEFSSLNFRNLDEAPLVVFKSRSLVSKNSFEFGFEF